MWHTPSLVKPATADEHLFEPTQERDEIQLLIPDDDVEAPELSIVVPALNEQITIVEFVRWCKRGLADAGIQGEILIIDSSTDETPARALENGARVLRTPKRGLGRAYIDALPFIRGRYIVMGDADCTYDFRQLAPFVEHFRAGSEFIMGTRFKGYIEPGSMPALHRYFGTPFTTWILNRVYSSKFSDIHCGMRGVTLDAFRRMDLQSQSWEYASEMVLKSVHLELRTTEVPVRFLKDRDGRVSHHRRAGWFSPWQAAWINLRAMFVYGADFFVFMPGLIALVLGVVVALPLSLGPITIGRITFSLYSQLFAISVALVGLVCFLLGCVAKVFFDFTGRRTRRLLRWFSYTRASIAAGLTMLVGVVSVIPLFAAYFSEGLNFRGDLGYRDNLAATGSMFIVGGFFIYVFTLMVHAAAIATKRQPT
jgi:glycosyltransferase involved in cell wall biosynthesis